MNGLIETQPQAPTSQARARQERKGRRCVGARAESRAQSDPWISWQPTHSYEEQETKSPQEGADLAAVLHGLRSCCSRYGEL